MHEALDRESEEVFSTMNYHSPNSIGLKWETCLWNKLMPKRRPSQTNEPFTYREGWTFARWKSRGRMPTIPSWTDPIDGLPNPFLLTHLIHIDDTSIGAIRQQWGHRDLSAVEMADTRTMTAVQMFRNKNVTIQDAKIEHGAPTLVVAGTKIIFGKNLMTLPDDKWTEFEATILTVCEPTGPVTVLQVMQAAGVAAHTSNLFQILKLYLSPISRFIGHYAWYKRNERMHWHTIKKQVVEVPKSIRDLLLLGWRKAKALHFAECRPILATAADATLELSCDASGLATGTKPHPAGLGAINHTATKEGEQKEHEYFCITIPHDHPMSTWAIMKLEAITVLMAIHVWAHKGDIIIIHEDNKTVEHAASNFRCQPTLAPFVFLLAQLAEERKLILRPIWTNGKVILADPLSRWSEQPEQEREFEKRCKTHGLEVEDCERTCGDHLLNLWYAKWEAAEKA